MYQRTFSDSVWQTARELLKGAYDLHIHTSPSIFSRRADDKQAFLEASDAGMAGIGLKLHEGDTASRAMLINDNTATCKVYGGITLNHFVGGLNPAAVEASLKMDGRIVWLPTLSSKQHVDYYKRKGGNFLGGLLKHGVGKGISVLGEDGKLLPEMYDIFDLVSAKRAILSTGHISPTEALAVANGFSESQSDGYVIYGHPDLMLNQATIQQQQEFVHLGGVIEKCTMALHQEWGHMPIESFVDGIKTVGVEHCFITTDAGFAGHHGGASSPDTLTKFIALVTEKNLLTEEQLRIMLVENPKKLLGL